MNNPKRHEAIKKFLDIKTHSYLAKWYNINMEVQVNVAQDGGKPVASEKGYAGRLNCSYEDDVSNRWYPFRIPKNANSDPIFEDKEMTYDLAEHVEGIGLTGWNWKDRVSERCGFDFDAITGHSERHQKKMSDSELVEVQKAALNIPWVTALKSTGGKGLHLYVKFNPPIPTKNHTEHAALSRSVLGMMSALVKFDFLSKVDVCGGNMWIWHRKMSGTDGLTLIKDGGFLSDVPINWKDHIPVVSGKRRKNLPQHIDESKPDAERLFEEMTGQNAHIPLDEEHKKFIDYLKDNNAVWWWDADHHMLVTHTIYLKEAHEALSLRGIFQTLATGAEKGSDINCYMFPNRHGSWSVRRYSPGCAEAPTWDQDGQGWTRCYFNRDPDLRSAALSNGGCEVSDNVFQFKEAEIAVKTAVTLGVKIPDIPVGMLSKKGYLKHNKDGRLIVEIERGADDGKMEGWADVKGKWRRFFNTQLQERNEVEISNNDDLLRHLVTDGNPGDDYGWVIKSDGVWKSEPLVHVKHFLKAMNYNPKEVDNIIGAAVQRAWTMVNRPFEPEYPGDRKWNRGAAQFRVTPSEKDRAELKFPHWIKVLNHCGKGLDSAVSQNGWCKAVGINTGGDYLKCVIASMFQFPTEPTPYIFLYGNQNSGKSILHEAISLLVTSGVVRADAALTSQSNFNGELEHAILCVVEETDLRKNKQAYNRIKDWVTSKRLPIHVKMKTPYDIENTTHWIQCANDADACPIFPGDTRITMIYVPDLEPEDLIPKKRLLMELEKESSDFIAELLALPIPESNDRLNVPVIATSEKVSAEKANRTLLEVFIDENCHYITGKKLAFAEFYSRFEEWCDPNYIHEWSKIKVGRKLPPQFPKARLPQTGQLYIGNISWTARGSEEPILPKLIADAKDYLVSDVP